MRKNKNIWFLIVGAAAVVILAVAVFFVVQQVQSSQLTFTQDGYVLKEASSDQQSGGTKAQPLYFKAGAAYAAKYPSSVVFSDVQSNQTVVDESSFLHFADGSITALSSGVVLNLGDMEDQDMIRCYGLKSGTVMQRSAGSYMLDHMGTPITYNRLIWKLGTEKYLVAADSFELRIPNQNAIPISGYVEIEYVDNGIVSIYNNEMMMKTIASDCELVFDDGVVINLSDRNVVSGGEVKMSFAQMIIDSEDNINVMPLDKKDKNAVIPKFVAVDGKNGENGKSGDGGKAGEAGNAGELGDSVGPGNPAPTTAPEKSVILPEFEVNIDQSALTASSVKGNVHITDQDSRIVPGTVSMKILNNTTGQIVFGPKIYDGFVFDFEATGLAEDTEYRLIFEAQYTVNNEQFSKIFYDGVFVADAIGLSFDIDSAQTNALSFKVKKEAFSPVTSAVLNLYDASGKMLDQKPISFVSNTQVVAFDTGLTPNTGYSAQLAQVGGSYTNGTPVQYDKYGEPLACKTLKRTPTVGKPNVTVNKRNGTFELQVSGFNDPDNGVQKIRYELYETGSTTPVSTAYGVGTNRVDIDLKSNGFIQRNVGYTARAVAEFSDNHTTIDVESTMSDPFIMEGANFPTLIFDPDDVDGIKFDRINGTLIIKVSETNGATVDTASNITVHWQDSVGNVFSKTIMAVPEANGDVNIDFDENGLRQKETYSIWVTAKVNMNDSNPADEVMIGPVKVQTIEAGTFAVGMSKTPVGTADPTKAISIDVKLSGDTVAYEASTLGSLVFNLYEGSTKDKSKLLSSLPLSGTGGDTYTSKLKTQFYDRAQTLTEADFGLNSASLTSSTYLLELESAHDYTDHDSNYFKLNNNTFAFIKSSTPPVDPPADQRNNQFDITPITKATAGNYKVNLSDWLSASTISALNSDTVIGYEVSPKFNNSGKYARLVNYRIHKLTDYQDSPSLDNTTAVNATKVSNATINVSVPVDASQDYLPHLVVFFGSQGTAQTGFVGSDKTRYYTFTGYEQQVMGGGFGRGAQYFFSYTAKLNTIDSTASYNVDYPSNPADDALLLYSTVVTPKLQAPTFALYPSTSGSTSIAWKYQYTDLDNVLQVPTATLYCRRANAGAAINNQTITKTTTNFNTVTFTNFTSAIPAYELYVQQNLLPRYSVSIPGANETRVLLSRPFETDNLVSLNYSVYVPDDNKNRLFVLLGKDAANIGVIDDAVFRRIAGAEVTATSSRTSKVMNLGVIKANVNGTSQACVEVPYTLLSDFNQGENITFTVRVFYDTGQSGFDTGANAYAVQFPVDGTAPAPGNYRVIRSIGTGYTDSANASGSWFHTVVHNASTRTITYGGNAMAADPNLTGAFGLTYADTGASSTISGSSRLITLKALKTVGATATGTTTVSMPVSIPEVTIDLNADVSVGIDSISGQFKLTGVNVVTPPNFYIEFYDERMQQLNSLTLSIPVTSGTNNIFRFTRTGGLDPATVYYFRIAGYINGQLVTFYDTAAMQPKYYQFRTLGEVHIQNVSITYDPVTYADKSLYANFTLDTTMGFKLAYDFVRNSDGDVLTDEELAGIIGTVDNARSMRVPLSIDPATAGGDWFKFGGGYSVTITAYSGTKPTYNERQTFKVDAANTETRLLGQTKQAFNLDALNEPIVGLSATASADTGVQRLTVRVAPGDWDRTIVDDLYLLRIYNSNGVDVTPVSETGAKLSTAAPYSVVVSNLAMGSEYTIRCFGVTDLQNAGVSNNITEVASPTTLPYLISEIKAYTLDSSGISVGTVTPRKSPDNASYVQLTFTNSVNLTDLTELRYTIYKGGQAVEGLKKISFTDLKFDATNNYYYINLETVLPGTGSYAIQVQYYKGSLKVGADATYSYIYS